MKILAINGSPNKNGATTILVDIFLESCKEFDVQCDIVYVDDYSMSPDPIYDESSNIIACTCDDDYMQLKARILDADVIAVASPYYNGRPTEQMEVFLQKFFYSAFVKKDFRRKIFIGLATSAVNDATQLAWYCANLGYRARRGGFSISGVISAEMVMEDGFRELREDREMKIRAQRLARKVFSEFKSGRDIRVKLVDAVFRGWINGILYKVRQMGAFSKKRNVNSKNGLPEFFLDVKQKVMMKNSRKVG